MFIVAGLLLVASITTSLRSSTAGNQSSSASDEPGTESDSASASTLLTWLIVKKK
jgi:hypothetical protein